MRRATASNYGNQITFLASVLLRTIAFWCVFCPSLHSLHVIFSRIFLHFSVSKGTALFLVFLFNPFPIAPFAFVQSSVSQGFATYCVRYPSVPCPLCCLPALFFVCTIFSTRYLTQFPLATVNSCSLAKHLLHLADWESTQMDSHQRSLNMITIKSMFHLLYPSPFACDYFRVFLLPRENIKMRCAQKINSIAPVASHGHGYRLVQLQHCSCAHPIKSFKLVIIFALVFSCK